VQIGYLKMYILIMHVGTHGMQVNFETPCISHISHWHQPMDHLCRQLSGLQLELLHYYQSDIFI